MTPDSVRSLYALDGQTAIVTGGASGIGRAIALGFACAGARIALLDRDVERARACAVDLAEATGQAVRAYPAQVSDEAQMGEAIGRIRRDFERIDILVNGAGHNVRKPLVDYSCAEFDSLYEVHVRGAFLGCRAIGPVMRGQGSGSIINICSVMAHVGWPDVSAYAAAKGALLQLTRAFALEMAPYGVRVNALSPGFIDTPLTRQHDEAKRQAVVGATPMGRFGRVDELVGPALFLASGASSFVTGSSLVVDGGWLAQ